MKQGCAVPSNLTTFHQSLFEGVFAKAFEKYLRQAMDHPLGHSIRVFVWEMHFNSKQKISSESDAPPSGREQHARASRKGDIVLFLPLPPCHALGRDSDRQIGTPPIGFQWYKTHADQKKIESFFHIFPRSHLGLLQKLFSILKMAVGYKRMFQCR